MEDPETSLCGVNMHDAVMEMFEKDQKVVIIAMKGILMDIAVKSGYCNWDFLDEGIFTTGVAIGLPQDTPFKERIDGM